MGAPRGQCDEEVTLSNNFQCTCVTTKCSVESGSFLQTVKAVEMGAVCCANPGKDRGDDEESKSKPTKKKEKEFQLSEKDSEYAALVAMTNFNHNDIEILREKFEKVSNTRIIDGKIHKVEFLSVLGQDITEDGHNAPLIYHRVFEKFDYKKNNTIDFQEFVCGLSNFAERAPLEQKIRFAFTLFDLGNDDMIHRDEVKQILEPSIRNSGLRLSDDQVDRIVAQTFVGADHNNGDALSYSQFFEMCHNHPEALSMFTIPAITERSKEKSDLSKPASPSAKGGAAAQE